MPPNYIHQSLVTIVSGQELESPARLIKIQLSGSHPPEFLIQSFWVSPRVCVSSKLAGAAAAAAGPRPCQERRSAPSPQVIDTSGVCLNTCRERRCDCCLCPHTSSLELTGAAQRVLPSNSTPVLILPAGVTRNTPNPHRNAYTYRLILRKRTDRLCLAKSVVPFRARECLFVLFCHPAPNEFRFLKNWGTHRTKCINLMCTA